MGWTQKWLAAAMATAACGGAWAAGEPAAAGQRDYLAMRAVAGPVAPMLAACSADAPLDALLAFIATNTKATVFVSGSAIAQDGPLRKALLARKDLFEIGNLGASCGSKTAMVNGIVQDAAQGRPETAAQLSRMGNLAKNVVEGSVAIEKAMGTKPRFFAFGLDFDNSATDPFEQSRLLAGIGAYLERPAATARYDALARSKAFFGARVVMIKMERGGKAYGAAAIEATLRQQKAPQLARKGSEAWAPNKRGALAKELGQYGRGQ